jgi:tetratricopeptide (TPR) repeat protein
VTGLAESEILAALKAAKTAAQQAAKTTAQHASASPITYVDWTRLHHIQALVLFFRGKFKKAIEDFEKPLLDPPRHLPELLPREAEYKLPELLRREAEYNCHMAQAFKYYREGRFQKAAQELEKCKELATPEERKVIADWFVRNGLQDGT